MLQINTSMNYQKIYTSIITKAQLRKTIEYGEKHHIVPKCMGGTNDHNNIVKLSYREHFLCHWLLCRIYPNNHKLLAAFSKMLQSTKTNQRIVSSRQFEIVKRTIENTHFYWLKENIQKNGPWNKGKKGVQVPWNKGIKVGPHSDESNLKRSKTAKEYFEVNIHPRKNSSPWNKGKKGVQVPWNKGMIATQWTCPHCMKVGRSEGNAMRWHFDNCKLKGIEL